MAATAHRFGLLHDPPLHLGRNRTSERLHMLDKDLIIRITEILVISPCANRLGKGSIAVSAVRHETVGGHAVRCL
ncbi:hypothetical protein D1872_316070 [compost metagenome]